jgi:hypothetical protein
MWATSRPRKLHSAWPNNSWWSRQANISRRRGAVQWLGVRTWSNAIHAAQHIDTRCQILSAIILFTYMIYLLAISAIPLLGQAARVVDAPTGTRSRNGKGWMGAPGWCVGSRDVMAWYFDGAKFGNEQ